jgi:hypothetical protein
MRYIIFLFFVTSVFAQGDFKNSNWGDTKAQVKKQVKGKPTTEDGNRLTYRDKVMTYDVDTWYEFNHEGKLYLAGYIFSIEHTSPELYFDDYNKVKENISKKYGVGIEKDIWNNDMFKDSPGTALLFGQYKKICGWSTPKSGIFLALSGDNYIASFGLLYQSTEVKNEEKSEF